MTISKIFHPIKRIFLRLRHEGRKLLHEWLIMTSHCSDMIRYMRYSFRYARLDRSYENISAAIVMDAHAIEKGLSLPEIRPAYGEMRINRLAGLLKQYQSKGYPPDGLAVQKSRAVFTAYLNYHEEIGFDLGDRRVLMEPFAGGDCSAGGFFRKQREELLNASRGDLSACALSRYSVRDYSDDPVEVDVIREAVDIARKTPSVCNRQPWHLYMIKSPELKKQVLELQSGNRGFGHRAACLLVVTGELRKFWGGYERNEVYIDGGLFSMSLMYALHYKGLGACPLNWMVLPKQDARMRKLLGLDNSEVIIMILAVGNLPETVRVAKSVRYSTDTLLTVK